MARAVRVRRGRPVFPGDVCVNCLRPARQEIELFKVKGRAVRRVQVPFCDECIALRRARSPRQVLFVRAATGVAVLLAVVVGWWVYVVPFAAVAPEGRQARCWGVLLGVLSASIVFGTLHLIIGPWSRCFRTPETKAVLGAVRIKDFDWESTTIEFADEEYAAKFAQLNEQPVSHLSQQEIARSEENAGKENLD